MDFKILASHALNQAQILVPQWLPGGSFKGNEWVCGDLGGGSGKSCSVNLRTGKWADFSTGEKGGDLISLYAAIKKISQIAAANEVGEMVGYTNGKTTETSPQMTPQKQTAKIVPPPKGTKLPDMVLRDHGKPEHVYKYTDTAGAVLFLVSRYADKHFSPWTYTDQGKWQRKGWPVPRPIYRWHMLADNVIIVEGEKAADYLATIIPDNYSVTTWPNGAQSADKTDWSPLYGRSVIIWPDHDEAGRAAAAKIAVNLLGTTSRLKIIDTTGDDLPDGWDAADSGFSWQQFIEWAKPRAKLIEMPPQIPTKVEPEAPPMPTEPPPQITNIMIAGDEAISELTTELSSNVAANIQRCNLQASKKGIPTENLLNVSRVLTCDFQGKFWFDEFRRSFMTSINGEHEALHDTHIFSMQALLQANYGLRKVSKTMVTDGITSLSYMDRRNSAKDYFLSLKWDGAPRMDDFFANACGAEDNPLNQAISRYFFSSLIARILGPDLDPLYGNKVDSMLVIEGDQGLAKGMLLKILAGKSWHFEVSRGSKDKDFFQDMRGKLIGEVAELAAFDGQNLDTIKRVISCQTDRLRVSYGKESEDFDRTCVLVGTTNKDEYLTDDTGNRRFLPIKVTKIDLDYVKENREQVFAEAVQYYRENVDHWWSIPKDLLGVEHAKRMVQTVADEYRNKIDAYLKESPFITSIQISDLWVDCFKQEVAKLNRKNRDDLAVALRSIGWINKVVWDKQTNKSIKRWVRGDA